MAPVTLRALEAGSSAALPEASSPVSAAAPLVTSPRLTARARLQPAIALPTRVTFPLRAPRALVPLYVSFAALQALDYHSTERALSSGAGRETNPVTRLIAGNRPVLIAAKAAGTAGVIIVGERMWKKNRAEALVFMAAVDGAMAAVVAHNYTVVRKR